MAVANSDASSLLGGWSFRRDNLNRSLSHFVNLWDGDATSIDRKNPDSPEIFFYQRRLTALIMGQVDVVEEMLFSQSAANGFTPRCLSSIDRERPRRSDDASTSLERSLDVIQRMRELVIRRRADQDSNLERLRSGARRPVIYPEDDARNILAASAAKFEVLADNADNPHERGFWSRAQEQTARYAATLAYVRMLEGGIPRVLGPRPLHQAGGGPSPGGYHLARRAHQVLRNPSSLGKNHPAGQGNHHDAAGQEGKGREGRRDHRHPKRPLTVRQGAS